MSEDKLTQQMFMWHWNTYPNERKLLFHVPNESKTKMERIRNKAVGVVAGVSDFILLANGTAYMIEVKLPKGAIQKSQVSWREVVEEKGYTYKIIRTLDEFKTLVKEIYLPL